MFIRKFSVFAATALAITWLATNPGPGAPTSASVYAACRVDSCTDPPPQPTPKPLPTPTPAPPPTRFKLDRRGPTPLQGSDADNLTAWDMSTGGANKFKVLYATLEDEPLSAASRKACIWCSWKAMAPITERTPNMARHPSALSSEVQRRAQIGSGPSQTGVSAG